MRTKIAEKTINPKKSVVWPHIVVNLSIGIFICPIIYITYLIIGFGEVNTICIFIVAILFSIICGGIAYYYAKKIPKLFLLWPILLSLPLLGVSLVSAVNVYLEFKDLTASVFLIIPSGMLSFGLIGSWIGYYFQKLEKEYRS